VSKTLNKKEFWDWAQRLVNLLTPLMCLLRLTDSAKPAMGNVLGWVMRVQKHVQEFDFGNIEDAGEVRGKTLDIIRGRWKWLRSPLHSVGWMLNPSNISAWHDLQHCSWKEAHGQDDHRSQDRV